MNIAIVIQARMGSSRLPGKVMKPLAGEPALARMLERVAAAATPLDIVVATTTEPTDEPIRAMCRRLGYRWFDGHPTDCLDRHVAAARTIDADVVVKIPSDCPLIDPGVIDRVLGAFLLQPQDYDYVSNLHPQSYPDGNDVEVVPFDVLERTLTTATLDYEREHTTPHLWSNPSRYRCHNVLWETGRDLSLSHRFVLDYPEDYEFISCVYDELYTGDVFGLDDILALLRVRPDLFSINAKHRGYQWYGQYEDQIGNVFKESEHGQRTTRSQSA